MGASQISVLFLISSLTVLLQGCGHPNFSSPVKEKSAAVETASVPARSPVVSSASDPDLGSASASTQATAFEQSPDVLSSDMVSAETPISNPAVKTVGAQTPESTSSQATASKSDSGVSAKADSILGLKPSDLIPQGQLSPTVYFRAMIYDSSSLCPGVERVKLQDPHGIELARVCPSTLQKCAMEGSCQISQNGFERSFNISGRNHGMNSFFESKKDDCPFGFGVQSICLDPFYSVAADPQFYKAGDVIYVPALRKQILPSGELHTGFLVVRDVGGGIKGSKRFDFFSGNFHWKDPENTFAKIQLADSKNKFVFFKVLGESAARIRLSRSFPGLPGAGL